ncbi:MAG TPA: hypothetical protein VFJ58_06665 [Armatimonadota bacterium]|nr:hypothetical protein [Armatimonadota bacterium]
MAANRGGVRNPNPHYIPAARTDPANPHYSDPDYTQPFYRVIMSLRRNTTNENDRAATGPRRSLAPYGGPIFRRECAKEVKRFFTLRDM